MITPVAFGGEGRKHNGGLFGSVLGEPPDCVRCVTNLKLPDLLPLIPTWRLPALRFLTRGVACLREWACGCLDLAEC